MIRRSEAAGLALVVIAVLLGAYLTHRGASHTGELRLDIWWSHHRPPWLAEPSRFIAHYGAGPLAYLPVLALLVVVWRRVGIPAALATALVFLVGRISVTVAKAIYQRPRPPADVVHALVPITDNASMPSGHTALAAAFAGALVYAVHRSGRCVIPALLLGVVLVVVYGVSRMVVGAHYLGDVTVGALLPAGVMLLVGGLLDRSLSRRAPR
ncbi:phosphatase PAP2 family protein [Flexivirga meconopsidis]|uniref:phosphatase PAP2 family protein n=1 Tax=Flexivirga meconopsidis TaxID=2977121 RepID=UPI00223F8371|nr:phosphatase PAP2 family protein [Flexivirga meconopsidis]